MLFLILHRMFYITSHVCTITYRISHMCSFQGNCIFSLPIDLSTPFFFVWIGNACLSFVFIKLTCDVIFPGTNSCEYVIQKCWRSIYRGVRYHMSGPWKWRAQEIHAFSNPASHCFNIHQTSLDENNELVISHSWEWDISKYFHYGNTDYLFQTSKWWIAGSLSDIVGGLAINDPVWSSIKWPKLFDFLFNIEKELLLALIIVQTAI